MSEQLAAFHRLFSGNPAAHYVRKDGKYEAVDRGVELDDVARHLRGEEPSLLAIPIDERGLSHFGAIDIDRHAEADPPLDHAALARKVTELGLPLVLTRSKSPKSGHLWLFLKETDGFPAVKVRRLLTRYRVVLELDGEIEIFPKQDALGPGQKGNGINLPYFGSERVAFGEDGEELNLERFISLSKSREVYGSVLEARDLANVPLTSDEKDPNRPLPANVIRDLHRKNLENLRDAAPGTRNATLNTAAFFAGRAFAAGVMERTEKELRDELERIARDVRMSVREIEATIRSGWSKGAAQPLTVLDLEKERDEAFERLQVEVNAKATTRNVDEVLRDAARQNPLDLEPLRSSLCRLLNLRPKVFDDELRRRRPHVKEDDELSGTIAQFEELEPWDQPVDLAGLLTEICELFKRHVYFRRTNDADTVTLWSVLTHARDCFRISPYLRVTSPVEECGKTTLLRILSTLVYRPLRGSNISSAVVFRVIELYRPTLVIDELDTYLETDPAFIGILNSGHEKDMAFVLRTVGEDHEVRAFSTWGPKAYGMIGGPVGAFASRSIPVILIRKTEDEHVEDFDHHEPQTSELVKRLHRQVVRWVKDNEERLRAHRPDATGLDNRSRDNWRPLLAIADLAGGEWVKRSRVAAGLQDPTAKETENKLLLRDIRNIFHTRKVPWLSSRSLVGDLLCQRSSPWSRYGNSRDGLNEYLLAQLLKNFGVEHSRERVDQLPLGRNGHAKGPVRLWGYSLAEFDDLFKRLLADEKPTEVEVARDV